MTTARSGVAVTALTGTVLAVSACSSTGPELCSDSHRVFSEQVCLILPSSGALDAHRVRIESEVEAALVAIRAHHPLARLEIRLLANPSGVIPEVGIGGFNPGPYAVEISVDPDEPQLDQILRDEMPYHLAHEAHHALRRRSVGYGSTLYEAAITEGLADHFALEVVGGSPQPWSIALTPPELTTWTADVLAGTTPGYDHRAWFVGGSATIPRWTGYAVGFELVRAYLEANPSATAAGLVDTPASEVGS